jgi:hypothetical protein
MKRVFTPPLDGGLAGYVRGILQPYGIAVGFVQSHYVVAFTDFGALQAPWVCTAPLEKMQSRLEQQRFHFAIPAVAADGDLAIFGDQPVFVKPDMTLRGKSAIKYAYTEFASASETRTALAMLPAQERAQLVVQPSLGSPVDVLEVDVAFNGAGQALVFQCAVSHDWVGHNDITKLETIPLPVDVAQALQEVATTYGIRNCIHNAQFVQVAGAWLLMDWNPRMAVRFDDGFVDDGVFFKNALMHMLDEPTIPGEVPYMQHRNYRWQTVSPEAVQAARDMGFRARMKHRVSPNKGLDALVWFGDKATADAKFTEFEALL